MPNLSWEQTQFRGIHTQPAKTADGHLYAEDTENLRIDGDGWLQLRSDVIAMDPDGGNITGVAASREHVWTLRADGKLYVRRENAIESETEIIGVANMTGRLSLVDFGTYSIITSEGTDQGYIVDVRDGRHFSLKAVPLGLDAPTASAIAVSSPQGNSDMEAGIYHYRIVYVSARNTDDVFYGMASNPSPPQSVDIASDEVGRITFSAPSEDYITGVYIYRAKAVHGLSADRHEYRRIDNLEVNRGSDLPKPSGTFTDIATEEQVSAEGELLTDDNNRLPAEAKQIFNYNDLIFSAIGDRLVYSDLRQGVIVPWAFPRENDIRVQGSVNFCGEINEVLLFGSRDGLWRLAGNTEYNFAVGQISNSGPIDGYAWSRITDALAFVGEGGLFITDASQVIRASETVLDDFFQNRKVVRGAVAFFKDGDILYAVTLEDRDGNTQDVQFKREDGYYVRWNLPFMQSASIIEANKATLVLVADGTGQLKRLDWNSTINEAETDVAWSWTSQFLDEPGTGLANQRKRYSQFQFTGEAENAMTLQVWKDNEVDPAVKKTFESRANLIPVRVPINRIARRLRFKLSGKGRVKIQGMRVEVMV